MRAPNMPEDANTTADITAAAIINVELFFLVQFIQRLVYEVPLTRVTIVDFGLASRNPFRNAYNRRLRRIWNPERGGNQLQLREQLIGQLQLKLLSRHCHQFSNDPRTTLTI